MAISKINTNSIADDAVTTAKVNPAQTDITSLGTLTSLAVDGAVTINESGAAVDFRVEGDSNTNLLLVDGSADRVGINTSSPDAKLDVEGTTDAEIRVTRTTASFSSSNTDAGSVLHLSNEVEFENV